MNCCLYKTGRALLRKKLGCKHICVLHFFVIIKSFEQLQDEVVEVHSREALSDAVKMHIYCSILTPETTPYTGRII